MDEEVKNEESNDLTSEIMEVEVETGVEVSAPEVEESVFEEVEIKKTAKQIKQETRTDSYFDGTLLELIGWSLLRYLITGVTLGIAGPWGDCMYYKYKISHMVLNGKRLSFVGNGGDLFIQRFKWFFFSIITLGIYAWWIPIKMNRWLISNIHFEDEEYVKGESYFDGKLIQLIGINILCYFLNIISFGILYAFTMCIKQRWLAKHTIINRKKIVFSGRALSLIGHYLLWLFLTIITFGIFGLWLGIKLTKWQIKNTHIKVAGEEVKKDDPLVVATIIILVTAVFIALFAFVIPKIDISSAIDNGDPLHDSAISSPNSFYY